MFRAHDGTLDRTVALKVLRPGSPVPPEALLAEARAAAALNHPNVCTIHAVETSLGPPMIVLEYVDGRPLSQRLDERSLPPEDGGSARPGGGPRRPEAGQHPGDGRRHGQGHGLRPGPAPPASGAGGGHDPLGPLPARRSLRHAGLHGAEQARGEPATPASDVFALGLILYEMVTGRRARDEGSLLEVLRRIDREDPARYAALAPEPFAGILRLALAADPARRRITMAEIAERLAGPG